VHNAGQACPHITDKLWYGVIESRDTSGQRVVPHFAGQSRPIASGRFRDDGTQSQEREQGNKQEFHFRGAGGRNAGGQAARDAPAQDHTRLQPSPTVPLPAPAVPQPTTTAPSATTKVVTRGFFNVWQGKLNQLQDQLALFAEENKDLEWPLNRRHKLLLAVERYKRNVEDSEAFDHVNMTSMCFHLVWQLVQAWAKWKMLLPLNNTDRLPNLIREHFKLVHLTAEELIVRSQHELDRLSTKQPMVDGGESLAVKVETSFGDQARGSTWLKSEPDDDVDVLHDVPTFGGDVKLEFTPDPEQPALKIEPGYEPPARQRKISHPGFGS